VRVTVTGGAGYIGSHVVAELLDHEHEVTVLDDLSLGLTENIDPRVSRFIQGSILDNNALEQALNGAGAVLHFAAWKAAGESMIDPAKYATNNIAGTLNLLNGCLRYNVRNFVFSSSAAVYGDPQYLPIDESHPLQPVNYYGYTKKAIEENLQWYSQLKGIRFAALRYFNATGYDVHGRISGRERNPANLSPLVMEVAARTRKELQLYGNDYDTRDGSCIRDYIHVNDLATAHVLALDFIARNDQDLQLNLGTGSGQTVFEVIEAAGRITGREIPYQVVGRRAGDPAELVAMSSRANELLNWNPQYSDLDTIFRTMMPVYL
jgi:UDP-glucose 4-epimerase